MDTMTITFTQVISDLLIQKVGSLAVIGAYTAQTGSLLPSQVKVNDQDPSQLSDLSLSHPLPPSPSLFQLPLPLSNSSPATPPAAPKLMQATNMCFPFPRTRRFTNELRLEEPPRACRRARHGLDCYEGCSCQYSYRNSYGNGTACVRTGYRRTRRVEFTEDRPTRMELAQVRRSTLFPSRLATRPPAHLLTCPPPLSTPLCPSPALRHQTIFTLRSPKTLSHCTSPRPTKHKTNFWFPFFFTSLPQHTSHQSACVYNSSANKMAFPQPFDNRPRVFRYIPRADAGAPNIPYAAAAPVAPVAPAVVAQPAVYQYPQGGYQYYGNAYAYQQTRYYAAAAAQPVTYAQVAAPVAAPVAVAATPTYYAYPTAAAATVAAPVCYTETTGSSLSGHPTYSNRIYGQTSYEVELNNRRLATERGAYEPKRIMPVANPDDLFWCRERDGQYTVRNFFNIENDCKPGRWLMDPREGYCVFHRE